MHSEEGRAQTAAVDDLAILLARELIYRFFGLVLRGPHEQIWTEALRAVDEECLCAAARLVEDTVEPQEDGRLVGALADVCRWLKQTKRAEIQAEYDRVFGLLVPKECPPYETEYLRAADAFQRAQVMADVAGFYRAFGLKPSRKSPERVDHIALMCEFMSVALMKQREALTAGMSDEAEVAGAAARKFFVEHLSWWVPAFAQGLRRKADRGIYADLAEAIGRWVELERALLGVAAPRTLPRAELIERPEESGGCLSCPLSGA